MKRILAVAFAVIFIFSFGFVTRASADHKASTASRYNQYLSKQNTITKLQTKLANTTDPIKVEKLQARIDKQTIKMNNIKPVVTGLNAYQRGEAKLGKLYVIKALLGTSPALEGKISKQGEAVAKAEARAITSEQKQYNKMQTKIDTLGAKLQADGLTQKQETRIQNKIDYLDGKASWLQSRTNSILRN